MGTRSPGGEENRVTRNLVLGECAISAADFVQSYAAANSPRFASRTNGTGRDSPTCTCSSRSASYHPALLSYDDKKTQYCGCESRRIAKTVIAKGEPFARRSLGTPLIVRPGHALVGKSVRPVARHDYSRSGISTGGQIPGQIDPQYDAARCSAALTSKPVSAASNELQRSTDQCRGAPARSSVPVARRCANGAPCVSRPPGLRYIETPASPSDSANSLTVASNFETGAFNHSATQYYGAQNVRDLKTLTQPTLAPYPRRTMREFGVLAVLVTAATCTGCNRPTSGARPLNDWKLATGRSVRPLQVQTSAPDVVPPFILLAYATSVDLRDTFALRKEAYAVWPRFLPYVRRAVVSKAVLQANESPFAVTLPFLTWSRTQRRFTFVLNQQPDGSWRMLGDSVALSGGGDSAFSSFGPKCSIAPLASRQSGAPPCVKRSILALPDSR